MGDAKNSDTSFDKQTEKLLTEIAKSQGFTDYKIEKGDGSIKGEGYMGIIDTVKICDKNSNSVLNLIVKSASKSDALRSQTSIEHLYDREIYIYETVFTTFKAFEEKKKLPPSNSAPKFYNSLKEYKCETLVLENLREIGYRLYERKIAMDENHIRLVLSKYGRFHALSFALKDQDLETFEEIVGCRLNNFPADVLKKGFIASFTQQCIKAQSALDENEDKKVLQVYKSFIDDIEPFFEDALSIVNEYSVILHGDCWTNNMMFKYEDDADLKKPTEVCFLDFQVAKLGLPVFDLAYFLYSCSPEEVINDLDYYLQLYYKSFSNYLKKLGSDPDKIFPYSVLQQQWKKYSRFGLAISLFIIHVMLTEKDEAVDLPDTLETGKDFANVFEYKIKQFDEYKRRIKPIILHFVNRGFI